MSPLASRPPSRWLATFAAAFLGVSSASAHLVTSGVGPFYDGLTHFFVTAEDLIAVIALALLGASAGRHAARRLVIILPLAWLAGTILGPLASLPPHLELGPPLVLLLTGLLVALNPRLPTALPAALAAVAGLLHGALNGRAMAETNTSLLAAAGIVAALAVVGLLTSALAVSLQRPWHRIAVRVLGSWTAAIGLLALAWQFRPGS